jgi:coenzyme F420-reducing hydrogenase beta subunit
MILTGTSCCGCGACCNICAKNAIQMNPNEEGFLYPVIDDQQCVDCGLCLSVCPTHSKEEILNYPLSSFAAWSKNDKIRFESSSGGVFSVIAEQILDSGGVVYGAAWGKDLKLTHICVEHVDQLGQLRGSKYLQSDIGSCYSEVKKHLHDGRRVCFCGTPCQIAGLKLFLRKDYDNLITLDFVCHGVPSQKIFDLFVADIESRKNVCLDKYNFRDKTINGWACNSSSSGLETESKIRKTFVFDMAMSSYMNLFMKGMISRESCYSCDFSQKRRCSDFTLGDFWGVTDVFPEFKNVSNGVSMLLVNTQKALAFLSDIEEDIILHDCSVDIIASYNSNLNQPTYRPKDRDGIKNLFSNHDFIKNNVPDTYYKDMSKYYIKKFLKYFL